MTEGHFPNQADRSSYVIVEGEKGSLVLISRGPRGLVEERTEVPRAHAEALLDVTPGKIDYLLSHLTVGTRDINLVRYVTPGPMDLISVQFESEEEARDFRPLSWFGSDVTDETDYQNRSIALEGLPQVPDVPVSNAALNSLLDTLENRYSAPRSFAPPQPQQRPMREAAEAAPPQPPVPASAPAAERAPDSQNDAARRAESAMAEDVEITEDEDSDLNIEDNVIRELARSLRPQRR